MFRAQKETDQTHRQPPDQNGSCGKGTRHASIWFGLVFGLVWTNAITPVLLCPCQTLCQNRVRGDSQSTLVGLVSRGRHFLCGFFNSSACHLAGSAIVPGPFSPCSLCRDESCHPLVISTFVAFVFWPYLRSPSCLLSPSLSCIREQLWPVVGLFHCISTSGVSFHSLQSPTMGLPRPERPLQSAQS